MARDLSALLAFLFLAGLCPSASAQGSTKPNEITKTEGDSVTFQADYSGPRNEVTWKIGADKLVELDANESHYYRLEDRASASFSGGNLTIRDLVESDSRDYSAHVLNKGEYHETKFILKVSLSEPSISCTVLNDKFITLSCDSSSKGVTYKLSNSTHVLSWGSAVNVSREGLNKSECFRCIVKSELSEISSNWTTCEYKPNHLHPGIIAAIVLAILAVIVGPIIFIQYRKESSRFPCLKRHYATTDTANPDDAGANASEKPENAEGSSTNINPEQDIKQVQEDPSTTVTKF